MRLSDTDIRELTEVAIAAARLAAAHIREEVGKQRDVLNKDGHTRASQVVTEVDFESQRLILEALDESMKRYDLGLLTEESEDDGSRQRCDYFWCIDPIDGTLPFIENIAGYSVSIGLVSRMGEPVIGVILDPLTDTVYSALRGGGALRDGEMISVVAEGEVTVVMDRSFQEFERYDLIMEQIRSVVGEVKIIAQGGAAMNACWVMDHAPAVYFKLPKSQRGGGAVWDFAASACLFSELAGGVVCDFEAGALKLNREGCPYMNREGVIYASSEELAELVRRMCR